MVNIKGKNVLLFVCFKLMVNVSKLYCTASVALSF
jgi:hypothetical protein